MKIDGFESLGGYDRPILVWNPERFRDYIVQGNGSKELIDWADGGFSPPVFRCNGFVWILSPGPQPDRSRYPK